MYFRPRGDTIIYFGNFSPKCCCFVWSKTIEVVVLDYLNELAPFATFKSQSYRLSIRTIKT